MFHIVDDAKLIREFITETLADLGYSAIAFNSPDSYIQYVNSPDFKKPIGVFADLILPGMNGYQMISKVSELVPDMRFVIVTNEPQMRSDQMGKACMFLSKPFTLDQLVKTATTLVRCHAFDPADDHGCSASDHRHFFPIEDWSCPHR